MESRKGTTMSTIEKKSGKELARAIFDILERVREGRNKRLADWAQDVRVSLGYAEPGYGNADGDDVVVLANWNAIDEYDRIKAERVTLSRGPCKLGTLFEKMGADIEWSDEWTECDECYKTFRTSPDCYSWTPSYVAHDDGYTCHECTMKGDIPELLKNEYEGETRKCWTLGDDLEEYGYTKVDKEFESGWHPGQTDDPREVAKQMADAGIERYVFVKDEQSQFYSKWSVWIHNTEYYKAMAWLGDEGNEREAGAIAVRALSAAFIADDHDEQEHKSTWKKLYELCPQVRVFWRSHEDFGEYDYPDADEWKAYVKDLKYNDHELTFARDVGDEDGVRHISALEEQVVSEAREDDFDEQSWDDRPSRIGPMD